VAIDQVPAHGAQGAIVDHSRAQGRTHHIKQAAIHRRSCWQSALFGGSGGNLPGKLGGAQQRRSFIGHFLNAECCHQYRVVVGHLLVKQVAAGDVGDLRRRFTRQAKAQVVMSH
jgi:hypothetical protein